MPLLASLRSWLSRATMTSPVTARGTGGWSAVVVREPYTGAWQQNVEVSVESALSNPTVYRCITLIASDIGKVRLRLVEQTDDDVWIETDRAAFSPFLRKPNRYQLAQRFVEHWMVSKLSWGNTYVLKQRDARSVVVAAYILDPTRVTPLVSNSGDVYYQLSRDDLAGLTEQRLLDEFDARPVAPASEIMHDVCVPLFHPLVGVSPLYAAALPALQALKITDNSTRFFSGGSQPGGILLGPQRISDETADRLAQKWNQSFTGSNVGKIAVLGDNLQYKPLSMSATDSQLIEQLKWTTETICGCFGVPAALVDASHQPPYANSEPLFQQYYSQCLQSHMTGIEGVLDDGLGLTSPLGTEFDIDDLIWFDTNTRTKAASETIRSGALSPNEARSKYFGLGPVEGGDTPYLQQQMFSLAALAERDADDPFSKPTPAPAATPVVPDENEELAKFVTALTLELEDDRAA